MPPSIHVANLFQTLLWCVLCLDLKLFEHGQHREKMVYMMISVVDVIVS